jgi:DNA-binding protein Fis
LPTLDQAVVQLIDEALGRTGGNQTIAAGLLGISRPALNKRLSRRRTNDESL